MSLSLRWNCLLLLAVFCTGIGSAQDISASIRGTVLDESGATVSAAKITAINTDTGLQRAATTNSQGAYVLVELPVGHYRLEAEADVSPR